MTGIAVALSGDCDGCGRRGIVVRKGRLAACTVCVVDMVDAVLLKSKAPRSHTAIMMAGELLTTLGQPLRTALRRLGERLSA